MIVVAVDCMGGDHGPGVTLPACRQFLDRHPEARLLLVGQTQALQSFVHERATPVAASEVIGMDDSIETALRRKKDSSTRVAIQQVKDGAAQVAVSAGNTGALMAVARYLLKTLDGIDRPAIATQIPNMRGGATTVLDLGANVDCTAEHRDRPWFRRSTTTRSPGWACSTSAKRRSRAARRSSARANCCAVPPMPGR